MEHIKLLTYHRNFRDLTIRSRKSSGFVMNRCFSFPLDSENTLITTNHGGWVILNRGEYSLLFEGHVKRDTKLYAILERTGIILTRDSQTDILRTSYEQHLYLNRTPNRIVIWGSDNESNGLGDEMFGDRLEEIGSKAVDFFLSIPQLHNRVHIEFRGNFLSQYYLLQKVMNYAMIVGWKKKKEVTFTLVSSPHLMTSQIARDIMRRRVQYNAYFDGTDEAIDGLKKFHQHRRLYPMSLIQLIAFPLDYIGQETRLVGECVALGLNRIMLKYADYSHPVEDYRQTNITSLQYYNFWKDTLELIVQYNRNGIPLIEEQTKALLRNIFVSGARSPEARRPCGAGAAQLIVDLTGRILACYCSDWLKMGSVFTDTYDTVINSENGLAARCCASDLLPKCSTCAFNAYCGHCPARSLQQHGTSLLSEPDDFECQSYIQMIPYLFNKLKNVKDAELLTKWV
ncbi:MAG: SPASM domain-containing protein [Candidatus Poribacteria bacterium]|nr:SPASM domain-containing protein [Candidatus Poribacteria bacterium]